MIDATISDFSSLFDNTSTQDGVLHISLQLHHLDPDRHNVFTSLSHVDHQSYLFDDSVGVVKERQGDDCPGGDGETQQVPGGDGDDGGDGGDGETQQVPGHTSAFCSHQYLFGSPMHIFAIHRYHYNLLATWKMTGPQNLSITIANCHKRTAQKIVNLVKWTFPWEGLGLKN